MNSLKPLLTVAVLAGIGYGVYVRINSGNDTPPPGVSADWNSSVPSVQLPEVSTSEPQMPSTSAPAGEPAWSSGGGSAHSSNGVAAPPFHGASEVAPPAVPGRGGEVPAYQVPSAAGNAPPYATAPPTAAMPSAPSAAPPYDNNFAENTPGAAETEMPNPAQNNPYTYLPPHDSAAGAPQEGAAIGTQPAIDPRANSYQAPDASAPGAGFAVALNAVRRELETGQLAPALRQLSSWYHDPQLSIPQRQQLCQLLDQVAGTVIYSTQHLLESPYEVQPGERLEDIAQRYNVPWQLLAKINGIDHPQNLRPGERLKVVRGPFNALISLEKHELTLLLSDGSYAGRFPISIGRDYPPQEGNYAVAEKTENPVYHGRDQAMSAEDPNNPLGERWIGLGDNLGIHGTNHPEAIGRADLPGSISLSPRDVADVFDILCVGSKVIIRR